MPPACLPHLACRPRLRARAMSVFTYPIMKTLLYLHGFNSSPASIKAQQTAAWLGERNLGQHFHCPALHYSPARAASQIASWLADRNPADVTCVGSSLGGFYATWVAERYGCRAVLINPAVRPHTLLDGLLGPQRNLYTGEEYLLTTDHMAELVTLLPARLTPSRYWLLVETGDETLDYRQAVDYYAGARQTVFDGGDHGFQHWQAMLPEVLAYAGIDPPAAQP